MGFIAHILVTAVLLYILGQMVDGIEVKSGKAAVIGALVLGLANAFVRPVLILLTLPVTILTLGLFILVVNAGMFGLVAAMLDGFHLSGFFAALFGALLVSITSWLGAAFIGPRGRYEVLIIHKRR